MSTRARPEFCTDAMLVFLDDLRESGITNMFGAAPYLRKKFRGLKPVRPQDKAGEVLLYWMHTFSERYQEMKRA